LKRIDSLLLRRDVDELLQAIDDTERTIDTFVPIFSTEMTVSAAKLYEQLVTIKAPYRSLDRVFRNPADLGSLKEASLAAVDGEALLTRLKEFCEVSKSKYGTEFIEQERAVATEAAVQRNRIADFLALYFEDDQKIDDKAGLDALKARFDNRST
jgi:hypothetical protein